MTQYVINAKHYGKDGIKLYRKLPPKSFLVDLLRMKFLLDMN